MQKKLKILNLCEILSKIQQHYFVQVNTVGNLIITNETDEYIGYVDFLTGEIEFDAEGDNENN